MRKIAYTLAICCSAALVSCGTGDENAANEMQEETRPNPGAEDAAGMTNPNTPGKQAGEGEMGGEGVDATMTDSRIGGSEMMPTQKIVENVFSNNDLSVLSGALRQAGLVDALNATGPYTLFAPQNEAFEALPEGVLEDLMQDKNKKRLTEILNNHVVAGKLAAAELTDGAMLKTLGGVQLTVTKKGNDVMVNGAKVVQADAASQNGVIHIIEKVLVTEK
ncbi:fasciclin domain-containing protein [Pontibacter anaerobius]|uniref:Fasciclin domain-containing protein n=1 Tax=Pontibacter anaerobius TaxID=2993940 RepID=A0ABT3RBP3_9BACT|nr:fasciclin domain-containing protein [Pontibacter anaerobius]MCX2738787.1 fasciclin domain-containing protein [Pontibacter anaerobius]